MKIMGPDYGERKVCDSAITSIASHTRAGLSNSRLPFEGGHGRESEAPKARQTDRTLDRNGPEVFNEWETRLTDGDSNHGHLEEADECRRHDELHRERPSGAP